MKQLLLILTGALCVTYLVAQNVSKELATRMAINSLPEPSYAPKELGETSDDYMPLLEHTTWIKVLHNKGDLRVKADIYENAGDSIFNGKKYRVIKEREINVDGTILNPQEWIYLFYEDIENKRTYVFDNSRQEDRLLYDFSVEVGDRLPSDESNNYILEDISIIENSGYTRKQFTFVHESDSIIWIEGIGNYSDFTRPYLKKYDNVKMLCVKNDNETIYDSGNFLDKSCDEVYQIYEGLISTESAENVLCETPSASKILRDGHLYIIVDGKEYTADGMLIR